MAARVNGEVVFINLFDIGRHVDLGKVLSSGTIPPTRAQPRIDPSRAGAGFNIMMTAPIYFTLDVIVQEFNMREGTELRVEVKIFEDGGISINARLQFQGLDLEQMHQLRTITFTRDGTNFDVASWVKYNFDVIMNRIDQYVERGNDPLENTIMERYNVYCIWDDVGKPEEFVERNKKYLSSFLLGENPALRLHENQVNETLSKAFHFIENDAIIFDYDRALLLDPNKDYEDVLLIAEIANYQLLELRMIDAMLDKHLSQLETDIRWIFSQRIQGRASTRKLGRKMAELTRLRVDTLFLLENVENKSNIVGDYFLTDLYKHLCGLFSLDEWSTSIRSRLDTLGDIYSTAKSDRIETTLLYLEIGLAFVFSMEFVVLLLDWFFK